MSDICGTGRQPSGTSGSTRAASIRRVPNTTRRALAHSSLPTCFTGQSRARTLRHMTTFWFAVASFVLLLVVVRLVREVFTLNGYKSTHPYTEEQAAKMKARSVQQSKATRSGQVGEHLYPLLPEFFERYNLKDARFVGQPIAYLIFDGLDEGREDVRVVLVEVKTGQSRLSAREKRIRDAVEAGRVEWSEVRLTDTTIDWSTITVSDASSDTVWTDDD